MKKSLIILMSASILAMAECTYETKKDVAVTWTAFKTPLKVGVGGTFKSVAYKGNASGKTLPLLLEGASVQIQTNNVDSNNPGRDAKLVQFFFNQMDGQTLDAKILKLDETAKVVTVEIIMNGKGLEIPMAYTYEKGLFDAKGVIDLGDFNALSALTSINRACYDLHSGKTWQDVNIGFSMTVEEQCGK